MEVNFHNDVDIFSEVTQLTFGAKMS